MPKRLRRSSTALNTGDNARRGAENGRPNERHTFQGSDAQDRRRLRTPCKAGRRTRKALALKRSGKSAKSSSAPAPESARGHSSKDSRKGDARLQFKIRGSLSRAEPEMR